MQIKNIVHLSLIGLILLGASCYANGLALIGLAPEDEAGEGTTTTETGPEWVDGDALLDVYEPEAGSESDTGVEEDFCPPLDLPDACFACLSEACGDGLLTCLADEDCQCSLACVLQGTSTQECLDENGTQEWPLVGCFDAAACGAFCVTIP